MSMKLNYKYFLLGMYCLVTIPLFSQNVYLEINLSSQAIQSRIRSVRPKSSSEVFRVIERAGGDKRIHGIILNISAFNGSQGYLWELRSSLEKFKATGKKVCVFFSMADIDVYTLASVADKIVMDEMGYLSMLGYAVNMSYVQHSLEKLGVGVREMRYLQYKSAVEMFTRDSMSEADRKQYGDYLNDIFSYTRDTLKQARSWTDEEFNTILNREFMYSAKSALDRKLVDYVGRKDAIVQAVKEMEGAEVKNFFQYGEPSSSIVKAETNYGPGRAGSLFSRPPVVAIVYANGQTDMERGMAARSLSRTIRELADKKRVRAIVLRINSPGGSAEAADYIDEAVRYAKQKKPVVVSMGQVAASGGYWAAMNANHITAAPYTITGSIGVIASWFYDNGLNSKLGVTLDSIQHGSHADLNTGFILPRRDLTKEEEERYKKYILDLYTDFTAKAAAGRKMDIEKIEAVAQGRIFSGISALNAGLIDSIGGISDAIVIARNLAEIPQYKKVRYVEYPKPKFMDKLMDRITETAVKISLKAAGRYNVPQGSEFKASSLQDIPASSLNGSGMELLTGMFLSEPVLADLRYRLEKNGQVMPILPLGYNLK